MHNSTTANEQFCKSWGGLQNSTFVFPLSSDSYRDAKLNFSTSVSPAKLPDISGNYNEQQKTMKSIIIMGILSGILSLFGCGNKTGKTESFIQRAKQIEITQLSGELALLEQNKTEFDFIGITSNGIDCIYFVKDNDKFQIEFEAMTEKQIPYIEKLKSFANQNGYKIQMTTYGNKPQYNASEASVLKIITNSNLEKTAEIGQKLQKNIFNNRAETKYDIVP